MTASEDLKFFANRLQGVMSLIPVIEKTESLENHNKELEDQVIKHKEILESLKVNLKSKKKEFEDLSQKIKDVELETLRHQNVLDVLKNDLSNLKSKL